MFKKLVFGRKSRPFTENVFNFLQHTNLLTTIKDELDCDELETSHVAKVKCGLKRLEN